MRRIRILHLEDNVHDAQLIEDLLCAENFPSQITRVSNRDAFLAALTNSAFDLILTDYNVPGYDGASALRHAREKQPEVPVIVISGSLGEEEAVKCLKLGATDYLLKERLSRLVSAIQRALDEAEELRSRRHAEIALRESEERFALVARATSDATWDWNLETNALWWGGDVEAFFGGREKITEPTITSWTDRVHPDDKARVEERLRAVLDGTGTMWTDEYRFRRVDGEYIYVSDRGFVIRNAAGKAVRMVGGMTDITQRKLAEGRFTAIFQSAPVAIGYGPSDGQIVDANPELCALLGYAREELIGRTVHELQIWGDPNERIFALEKLRTEKRLRNYEAKFRRRSGEIRTGLLSLELIEVAGEPMLLAMIIDITERKALEAQLRRVQRVESVGLLASGIAHDMNNILAPIMMCAPLLRMGLPPADVEKMLATIETSAQRGAALVRQLLIFGRGVEGERRPVHLADIVADVSKIVGQTFSRNITIDTQLAPDVWPVHGDATQLHQVLLNLCVNARDAMPDGGTLTIVARNFQIDETYAAVNSDAKPGRYVQLDVSDTGTGIAPEILDRIFDPFFTTKETGRGTGLGLSTVMGVVKSHGGFVRVRSELGHGTTFEIFLPASSAADGTLGQTLPTAQLRGHGESILIVDDEENIRAVLRETLVRHNYKVVTAQDGVEATAAFAANPEVTLVITDLDMPLMDGVNLGRVLRRLNPAIKIIVSTGLGDRGAEKRRAELDALDINAVLTKPYSAESLLTVISHALAEPKDRRR